MIKKSMILLLLLLTIFLVCCEVTNTNQIVVINGDDKIIIDMQDKQTFSFVDLPKLSKKGYNFLGWSFSENGDKLTDNDYNIKDNNCVYALWKRIKSYFDIEPIGKLFLTVPTKIDSKQEYENGTIEIIDSEYNLNSTNIRIRLRGNSSFTSPKKSYKIKFDKKEDLFGMGNDSEWCLIANYFDTSLIRNFLAYRLAQAMQMEYAIDCRFIEVYLNDENQGLYLLCETVKTGKNRINIETNYTIESDEIPFLLEMDFKMISNDDPLSNGKENVDFFYLNSFKRYPIATKYPKTYNDITTKQYDFIKTYIKNTFESVKNGEYYKYIDTDSCVDYYLVQELFMNIDMDYSSVYFYKKDNQRLRFGPIWDFDITLGNANYVSNYSPNSSMKDVNGGSILFNNLMTYSDVKYAFDTRFIELRENIFNIMLDSIDEMYSVLLPYEIKDNDIWNTLDSYYWPKPNHLVGIDYVDQIIYVKNYLKSRIEWMSLNM